MSEKEEHLFQQSNSCWNCKKLIDNVENKVRDHCYVTGKFRGAAHFFLWKDFTRTKSTKKHQKTLKAPKSTKRHKDTQAKALKAPKSTKKH